MKRFFPNGIPMEADFGTWLGFATNSRAREKAVRAIIRVDRAGSIPFLEWMSRAHLDWNEERSLAFAQIALAPPWWATNRPPRWSPEEQSAFALGYYQMGAKLNREWAERAAANKAKKDAEKQSGANAQTTANQTDET